MTLPSNAYMPEVFTLSIDNIDKGEIVRIRLLADGEDYLAQIMNRGPTSDVVESVPIKKRDLRPDADVLETLAVVLALLNDKLITRTQGYETAYLANLAR